MLCRTFYLNSNIFTLFDKFLFDFKYFYSSYQIFVCIMLFSVQIQTFSYTNSNIFMSIRKILFEFKDFYSISNILMFLSNSLFEFKYFYAL